MRTKWITIAALFLALGAGVWSLRDYRDAYSLRLHPPNESWLHDLPWDYEELHGAIAGRVQDSIFFGRGKAEIVAFTVVVRSRGDSVDEAFVKGFRDGVRQKLGGPTSPCTPVTAGTDQWNCVQWNHVVDGEPVRARAYLARRGITMATVLFMTHADNSGIFGDPRRWLSDVEWIGPSIFHVL